MKLTIVRCTHRNGQYDDALVVADDLAEAERVCRERWSADGYTAFKACEQMEDEKAGREGPARFMYWLGTDEAAQAAEEPLAIDSPGRWPDSR